MTVVVSNYVYPEAAELYRIQPDLADAAEANMLGLTLFPKVSKGTYEVRWVQRDSAYGLMALRGIDGKPPGVTDLGENEFSFKPGIYGEHMTITEAELLKRADPLNLTQRIDLSELVMMKNQLLKARQATRKEYNVWTLLLTGTLSIPFIGPTGIPGAYQTTFPLQTYTAAIPWATLSTATPIANLQALQQQWVGHGVYFGKEATLYINQVTANSLINNQNANDLDGRRTMFGATLNNIDDISNYFRNQNLPGISVYDEGFQTQLVSGSITNPITQFQKYIPNTVGVLLGKRKDGGQLGKWINTLCMENLALAKQYNNPSLALGEYAYIKDYASGVNAPKETPARIEINVGFNGGLTLEYPASIVSCQF